MVLPSLVVVSVMGRTVDGGELGTGIWEVDKGWVGSNHSIRMLGGTPLLTWRLALLLGGSSSAIRSPTSIGFFSCTSSVLVEPLHTLRI